MSKKDYDKEVAKQVVAIERKEEEETEKASKILGNAKLAHRFMAELGDASLGPAATLPASRWKSPECELTIQINDGKLSASGRFEKEEPEGALASLLYPGPATPAKAKTTTYAVTYSGAAVGHAVFFEKTIKAEGKIWSLLSSSSESGYMIVDASEIRVLKKLDKTTAAYERFQRIA